MMKPEEKFSLNGYDDYWLNQLDYFCGENELKIGKGVEEMVIRAEDERDWLLTPDP